MKYTRTYFLIMLVLLLCASCSDNKLEQAINNITNLSDRKTSIEKQVLSESIAIIKKSAEKGHVEAMYWMSEGRLLDQADPNFVSLADSVLWLEKAARKGHIDASASLAELFLSNADIKNPDKAYRWYFINFYIKNDFSLESEASMVDTAKLEFYTESPVDRLIQDLGKDKIKTLEDEARQWMAKYKSE